MQPHDLKPFSEGLLAAFDVLGARPPGAAGVELWFRTLRAHQFGDVLGALDAWAVRNRRAPTPSDIADQIRDHEIERRERQAERWKAEEKNAPYTMGGTEAGRRALAEIRRMVAGMQRSRRGRHLGWAHRIIDRFVDHDVCLSSVAFDTACDALGKAPEERAELRAIREANVAGASRAASERMRLAAAEDLRQSLIAAERERRGAR